MNRRRVAAMLAAAAAVIASSAEARASHAADEESIVVFERVGPSPTPQATIEFWTPERMAAAQPLELIVGEDGTPAPLLAPTFAQRIPRPYTKGARKQTGAVFFKIPGGPKARCTGTAVDSANGAVVWTAGHCVYHVPAGKFMRKWVFVPGYASSKSDFTPFGQWSATVLGATPQWVNAENPKFDLGAVVVAPKGGETLQDRVGGRDLAFNYPTNLPVPVEVIGYPSAPPFSGNRQYRCRAPLKVGDPLLGTAGPAPLKVRCDMTGGSSGGGWRPTEGMLDKDVISVVSYGYESKPNRRFGPYQGAAALNLFQCAEQSFGTC